MSVQAFFAKELWLNAKLGTEVFNGATDQKIRAQRFRLAIEGRGLRDVCAGKLSGSAMTYAQLFELIYGEKL